MSEVAVEGTVGYQSADIRQHQSPVQSDQHLQLTDRAIPCLRALQANAEGVAGGEFFTRSQSRKLGRHDRFHRDRRHGVGQEGLIPDLVSKWIWIMAIGSALFTSGNDGLAVDRNFQSACIIEMGQGRNARLEMPADGISDLQPDRHIGLVRKSEHTFDDTKAREEVHPDPLAEQGYVLFDHLDLVHGNDLCGRPGIPQILPGWLLGQQARRCHQAEQEPQG